MAKNQEALEAAISAMTDASNRGLFDVTIICTTDDFQADYWMKRLSEGVCQSSKSNEAATNGHGDDMFPIVLAVSEDWAPSGAGNGLGTLYAYTKACKQAKDQFNIDLGQLLKDKKVSAALYHTAGKGTRLAPLPASENNNKPGVRLPVCHQLKDGSWVPVTVLEAVVKQTGVYAASRPGRLSVFWGDQIFIPSAPFKYTPSHHADIMCTLLGETAPTADEWKAQGLDKYGVIAVSKESHRNAAQVEKVDHATAVRMLRSLGDIGQVGPSLGSFSVSSEILEALCTEFAAELSGKTAKMDTDPDFWMPLTLPADEYVNLMVQKGEDKDKMEAHHKRMTAMKEKFDLGSMGLFGAVDVGADACWWDYGQLKLYSLNNMKLLENDDYSADLLRRFFNVTSRVMHSTVDPGVKVDATSCVFATKIRSGSVKNSVVCNVDCVEMDAEDAIIVNCTARRIVAAKGAILYNVCDDSPEGVTAGEGDVIVTVTDEEGNTMELKSRHSIDGKTSWKSLVEGNSMSFEEVYNKNCGVNVVAIEGKRKELHRSASNSFSG